MIGTRTYSVNAQKTDVLIEPESLLISNIGETFSVNVSIYNVSNLFGYDFLLWYNTTLIDCLSVEWPKGHFLTPILRPTNFFKMKTIEDNFNETTGAVRVTATLTNGEPPKNGSGLLVKITFNSTATGTTFLRLYFPEFVYPVKLSDPESNAIPCSTTDGEVTVIPEFFNSSLMFLLLSIVLVVIFLEKSVTRKNKNSSGILSNSLSL
jgi:hypothetical protein